MPSTGPAPRRIHALPVLGPKVDALGAGIALDHALGVVVGVVGQRLDRDVVAGVDLDGGLQELAEIAPMHGVRRRRQEVVTRLSLPGRGGLGGRRRDQRCAARQGRCAGGAREGALQEAPPLAAQLVEQLLAMEVELRAIVIIACAHETALP